jgi:hypothetical protein
VQPSEPPAVEAGAPDTGGGLFEQSNAAAAAASAGAAPAASTSGPFTLTGYMRGDLFAGKVTGQVGAESKAA